MPHILSSHDCPFCSGEFSIVQDPRSDDLGVAHSAPECQRFACGPITTYLAAAEDRARFVLVAAARKNRSRDVASN